MCFCAESRYSRDLLIFSNPWDTRFPAKISGKEISWPSWEDHEGFYRQDLHWMGLMLLGSEAGASGGAGSSGFTSAEDKDGRKESDSGLAKAKGSGRDSKVF